MNTIFKITVVLIMIICSIVKGFAQDSRTQVKGSVEPFMIGVPFDKTINLVFPYSIKSVDRGSADVQAKMTDGIENVLRIKAAVKDFQPTNLTIITAEGALYSFLLHYNSNPRLLNFKVADLAIPSAPIVQFSPDMEYESLIKETSKRISNKQGFINRLKDKRNDIELEIKGIYIMEDQLYFQVALQNNSLIPYDIEQFRIYIRDQKKSKRTATQEIELKPVYTAGNLQRIDGKSNQTVVIALNKFTIPDKKYLKIEMMEKNGGRHLELKIKNKTLLSARTL